MEIVAIDVLTLSVVDDTTTFLGDSEEEIIESRCQQRREINNKQNKNQNDDN